MNMFLKKENNLNLTKIYLDFWYTLLISDILKDLIKSCEFYRTKADDVIIKQGDKGDA